MAQEFFTYQQEKDGLLAAYIAENPVHYRRNLPLKVEILTGENIPTEQVSGEENGI